MNIYSLYIRVNTPPWQISIQSYVIMRRNALVSLEGLEGQMPKNYPSNLCMPTLYENFICQSNSIERLIEQQMHGRCVLLLLFDLNNWIEFDIFEEGNIG